MTEGVMDPAVAQRQRDSNIAAAMFDFEAPADAPVTFWRQATPGTAYWRGYIPMKAIGGGVLPIMGDSLSWKDDVEGGEIILHRHHGDTAIWQFLGDEGRSRIVLQLQRQGIRTVMEVDDGYCYFAPPLMGKKGAWQRTHAEAVANGTMYSTEMHRKVVPMMDAMIVSTDHLAEVYSEYHDEVYVCPNSVNPGDWNVERHEAEHLRIGYYGSTSHVKDYPLAKKGLKAIERKGVEVVMAGFRPMGFTGTYFPWADNLFEARKPLGHMDVGIAPLKRNRWADCKSDLKAIEYAMAGVMPIVQDAPPFDPWKGWWPWIASTEDDWTRLLKEVAALDKSEVQAYAKQAKDWVLANRAIEHTKHRWEQAIHG